MIKMHGKKHENSLSETSAESKKVGKFDSLGLDTDNEHMLYNICSS